MKKFIAVILLLLTAPCFAGQVPPNGVDDTNAIKAELAARGEVTLLAGGLYKINCNGVRLRSGNRVYATGATLQLINTNVARCRMFETVFGAQDVVFQGGTLLGDRRESGDWQILVRVDGANNVLIDGVVMEGAGTDNLWIGGNGSTPSTNVRIVRSTFRNARRNGASATFLRNGLFHQNTFEGTQGADSPVAGLDLEPNAGESVLDVTLTENTFRNNAGPGLYAQCGRGLPGTDYVVSNNVFENNGTSAVIFSRILNGSIDNNVIRGHSNRTVPVVLVGNLSTDIEIHGNWFEGNFSGLYIQASSRVSVTGNTIDGYVGAIPTAEVFRSFGIRVQAVVTPALPADDVTITGNDLNNVRYVGIFALDSVRTKIELNRVTGTGRDGVSLQHCTDCDLVSNTIVNSGQESPNTYSDVALSDRSLGNELYGNTVIGTATRWALLIQNDSTGAIVRANSFGGPNRMRYPAGTVILP